MTVYCVMEYDGEGSFLCSIWSTEELAEAEVLRKYNKSNRRISYGVDEYEVQDTPK